MALLHSLMNPVRTKLSYRAFITNACHVTSDARRDFERVVDIAAVRALVPVAWVAFII